MATPPQLVGVPNHVLNHAQEVERDHLIWEYVRRGWTYSAVSKVIQEVHRLPCTPSRVKTVAHQVAQELHERFLDHAQEERMLQAVVLQEKAMRAFIEFERSCQDVEMEQVVGGRAHVTRDGDLVELPDQVTRTRKGQTGNPALLMAGLQALSDVRRLLGYNAPEELAVGPREDGAGAGLETKLNTLAQRLKQAQVAELASGDDS